MDSRSTDDRLENVTTENQRMEFCLIKEGRQNDDRMIYRIEKQKNDHSRDMKE